ncbi:DNA mismatch repair protein MutS [Azospirillaceae bacterium]
MRRLTLDDIKLWRAFVHDVEPLRPLPASGRRSGESANSDLLLRVPSFPVEAAAPAPFESRPTASSLSPVAPFNRVEVINSGVGRAGPWAELDRRTQQRLRRGQLAIEGRIDLHGMTQNQAHQALTAFVHRGSRENRRCLLVITGKGAQNPEGGVLRNAAPRWLGEPPLVKMVVAVQPAQPKDGGDGAFYVLLKRRRADSSRR